MPESGTKRWFPALLPIIAFLVMVPSLLRGGGCGHDMSFHMLSWLEAAKQFAHGAIYPAWAVSPAFNTGEPRFIFYPPLSWFEGAALISIFPAAIVTKVYVWIALSLSGLSLFFVARRFAPPIAAFIAASLYLANPYMLFTAFERSAFAELLAAAWIPWIFAAALREKPRAVDIAWPLALLWLTNAPAGVMASYTLLILGLVRVIHAYCRKEGVIGILTNFTGGAALGLAMTAVYLIPAAYERRFVQITMAIVPGLSVPQNFLFAHTADAAHDFVNHQVSWVALALLIIAIAMLIASTMRHTNDLASSAKGAAYNNLGRSPRLGQEEENIALKALHIDLNATNIALGVITLTIAILLFHPSQGIWLHLPELSFLQFPWRWLMVLAPVAALAVAIAIRNTRSRYAAILATSMLVIASSLFASRDFIFACDRNESPAAIANLFHTSHGTLATDEYTPGNADNDVIRFNSPAYWLSTDPQSFAPNSLPNPNAAQPDVDFGTPPPDQTVSQPAPHLVDFKTTQAEYVILNLRDYPNWHITNDREDSMERESTSRVRRDDGLIAIPVRAGHSRIDITWHTGRDREIGALITALSLAIFGFCIYRSRRIVH